MSFTDLYAARVRYATATPGSREWWKALRDIRVAETNLMEAASRLYESALSVVKSAYDTFVSMFKPVVEVLREDE